MTLDLLHTVICTQPSYLFPASCHARRPIPPCCFYRLKIWTRGCWWWDDQTKTGTTTTAELLIRKGKRNRYSAMRRLRTFSHEKLHDPCQLHTSYSHASLMCQIKEEEDINFCQGYKCMHACMHEATLCLSRIYAQPVTFKSGTRMMESKRV